MSMYRTLVEALHELSAATVGGYHFLEEGAQGSLRESRVPFPWLVQQCLERGGALQAAGMQKGDRVVLILPDTREFVITLLGAIAAGIVPVPVYPPAGMVQLDRYGSTVRSIVQRSRAGLLVANARLAPALRALHSDLPVRTSEQLQAAACALRPEAIGLDDLAFLQFTSGSTAQPKGVCVTHRNLASDVEAIREAFQLTPADVPVSWLPLFHDMGLIGFLFTTVYAQVSTRFMPSQMFLRRPVTWLRALSEHRGTISVAPNFAYALTMKRLKDGEIAKLDLSAWRIAGCGAEPIRQRDLREFAERLAPAGFRPRAFLPMYGLAEATLAVTIPALGSGLRVHRVDEMRLRAEQSAVDAADGGGVPIANCGPALSVNRLAIFAPDDGASARPLADGQVGEIRVKGDNVTKGYWEDAEATHAAYAGDYLKTGDLGYVRGGELFVCGRLKELLIVHGRNYFPDDVERAVQTVRGVRGAMAFQTHDAWRDGGAAARLVVAAETAEVERVDPAELQRALGQALGLSVDEFVLVGPGQLPRTSSGKPRRFEARRLYEAGLLSRKPARERGRPVGSTGRNQPPTNES